MAVDVLDTGLTPEQRQHFLDHGWVRISKAISPEMVEKFAGDVWVRLGYDKDDKSTWKGEKVQCYPIKPREYLLR